MQPKAIEVKTQHVQTKTTRTVDCFAKRSVKEEDGTSVVKVVRWQEERANGATLQTAGGSVFHRGARIA